MSLVRLIYASRASRPCTRADLFSLTRRAARSNRLAGISGTLVYCDGYFLQLLEGEKPVVQALLTRIHADRRHTDVQLLYCRAIATRSFGGWGMSCLHEDAIDPAAHVGLARIFAHIATAALARRLGAAAHRLLLDLSRSIDEQTRLARAPLAAKTLALPTRTRSRADATVGRPRPASAEPGTAHSTARRKSTF